MKIFSRRVCHGNMSGIAMKYPIISGILLQFFWGFTLIWLPELSGNSFTHLSRCFIVSYPEIPSIHLLSWTPSHVNFKKMVVPVCDLSEVLPEVPSGECLFRNFELILVGTTPLHFLWSLHPSFLSLAKILVIFRISYSNWNFNF